MSDKVFDSSFVNGVAILLSFYVGYKYGLSVLQKKLDDAGQSSESHTSNKFTFSDNGDYKMILVDENTCTHRALDGTCDFELFALLILSILSISVAKEDCSEKNFYKPQEAEEPNTYYICLAKTGSPKLITCPPEMKFNADTWGCAFVYEEDEPGTSSTCPTEGQVQAVPSDTAGTCPDFQICISNDGNLELTPDTCTDEAFDPFLGKCVPTANYKCTDTRPDCDKDAYQGLYLTKLDDCQSYYECIDGNRVIGKCQDGLDFDVITQLCIAKSKSLCSGGSGGGALVQDICEGKDKQFIADPNYCKGYYYCVDEKTPYWSVCGNDKYFDNGFCTETKPGTCKCEGIDVSGGKVYVPNTSDKTKYTICELNKRPVPKTCPSGYIFDADEEACVRDS